MKRKLIKALALGVFGVMGMTSLTSCDSNNPQEVVKEYTVTFNSNSGSAVSSVKVTEGGKVTSLTTPTREGYVFAGWYSDAAFTVAFTTNTVVNSDITVYAKWNAVESTLTYSQFMEKEAGEDVVVGGFIAAKQSWYNNKAVYYLVDGVGTGYFCYNIPCTQDDYNTKFTVGAYVKVTGQKLIYAGEHEVSGESAKIELATAKGTMPTSYELESVETNYLSSHMNCKFTATLTVMASDNGAAYEFSDSSATVENPKGDLYFKLADENGNVLSCVIESYLTSEKTDVYKYVLNTLAVGARVKVEGYLYWWNGANPHITSIQAA